MSTTKLSTEATKQKHINVKHHAQPRSAKLTPTIGWDGFTRKAGDVKMIPSTITSMWGRDAAYIKM